MQSVPGDVPPLGQTKGLPLAAGLMTPAFGTLPIDEVLERNMRPIVDDLLEAKANEPEVKHIKRIKALDDWIEGSLSDIKEGADLIDVRSRPKVDDFNDIFLKFLGL